MKRIGILGGASDQATADYYRRLNLAVNRRLRGRNTAELLISSMNFALTQCWVRTQDWDAAGRYLSERAQALEGAGEDLLLCASNTLHRVADVFTAGLSIPFLHIADPAGRAIRALGLSRVGLLGTKPAIPNDYLKRRFLERRGVEVVVPDQADQLRVDRIIFDELCCGQLLPESKALYLAVIDRLAERGVAGVILGCTEIPLLVAQSDRPSLPFLDTVELLVEPAVELALGNG